MTAKKKTQKKRGPTKEAAFFGKCDQVGKGLSGLPSFAGCGGKGYTIKVISIRSDIR